MIDINELRQSLGAVSPEEINELLDRLEAAEKERDALRNEIAFVKEVEFPRKAQAVADAWAGKCKRLEVERDALRALVVMRFDLDCPPQFTQGHDLHEFTEPVTAEHCRWFVAEIERLRDDCGALRAKIERMERQEPVAWLHETRRDSDVVTDAVKHVWDKVAVGSMAAYSIPLYALPDAQGE